MFLIILVHLCIGNFLQKILTLFRCLNPFFILLLSIQDTQLNWDCAENQNVVVKELNQHWKPSCIPVAATCSPQVPLWTNWQGISEAVSVRLLPRMGYSVSYFKCPQSGHLGGCRSSCCSYRVQLNLGSRLMVPPRWILTEDVDHEHLSYIEAETWANWCVTVSLLYL